MKQEELARILNVSQSSLSGYENEKYEPDKKTLLKLAALFGVTVDYLLGIDRPVGSPKNPCVNIPVYASLRADAPAQISAETYFFQPFGPHTAAEKEYFGLQVNGDIMAPRICAGDIIIAHRQAHADTGDIAIVQVGRDCASVIEIVTYETGITLVPGNPKYSPRSYTNEKINSLPVIVLGKAVELRRRC